MRNGTITVYPKVLSLALTFKPIVVASALEMGAITTDATTSVTVENLSPIQKSNVIIFTVMEMRR